MAKSLFHKVRSANMRLPKSDSVVLVAEDMAVLAQMQELSIDTERLSATGIVLRQYNHISRRKKGGRKERD